MKEVKEKKTFREWLKNDWHETRLLFKGLPALPFALLCLALVIMAILANDGLIPETSSAYKYIQVDAGVVVSWLMFLLGDMFVKRYGPKGALKINLAAIGIEVVAILLFAAGAMISDVVHEESTTVISMFSWLGEYGYFVPWAAFAGVGGFFFGIITDIFLNWAIIKRVEHKTSFKAYALASYTSTFVAQFVDNLAFGLFFSLPLGIVTWSNIWLFAVVGAVVELVCQIILSPIGYRIAEGWRKRGVGQEYVDAVPEAQVANEVEKPYTHPHSAPGA